jgi:hypothetical protein
MRGGSNVGINRAEVLVSPNVLEMLREVLELIRRAESVFTSVVFRICL